jgi:hypothetical protein
MSDNLVAFLRARLDDDERAVQGTWTPPGGASYQLVTMQGTTVMMRPARVLAEVKAKRQIIDVHPPTLGDDGRASSGTVCRTCAQDSHDGGLNGDPFPCLTLRLLALPYAGHAEYREEWRP